MNKLILFLCIWIWSSSCNNPSLVSEDYHGLWFSFDEDDNYYELSFNNDSLDIFFYSLQTNEFKTYFFKREIVNDKVVIGHHERGDYLTSFDTFQIQSYNVNNIMINDLWLTSDTLRFERWKEVYKYDEYSSNRTYNIVPILRMYYIMKHKQNMETLDFIKSFKQNIVEQMWDFTPRDSITKIDLIDEITLK